MGGVFTRMLGRANASEIINSGSVVGGEIAFTGLDLTPYHSVRVFLSGLKVNADDNSIGLQLELGGSVISAGYDFAGSYRDSANVALTIGGTAAAYIRLHHDTAGEGVGNAAGESLSGYIDLGNFEGSLNKYASAHCVHRQPDGHSSYTTVSGLIANASDVTGLRIYCTDGGGSLTAGRAFVMGLA